MDPVQRVKENFNESIQVKTEAAELLAPVIVAAADAMTNCLLGEHKICPAVMVALLPMHNIFLQKC